MKTAATVQNASQLKLNDDPDCAPLNHKRVARIMKNVGLCGYTRRRRVKTTVRAQGRHVFADGPDPMDVDTWGRVQTVRNRS